MSIAGHHAIVIGASMAGLLTPRVLTESYDRVTIVERDILPACGEHRRGVPHLPYLHAAAAVDGRVGAAFLRVSNLLDPPPSLLSPALVVRVLSAILRRRRDVAVEPDRPAVASQAG